MRGPLLGVDCVFSCACCNYSFILLFQNPHLLAVVAGSGMADGPADDGDKAQEPAAAVAPEAPPPEREERSRGDRDRDGERDRGDRDRSDRSDRRDRSRERESRDGDKERDRKDRDRKDGKDGKDGKDHRVQCHPFPGAAPLASFGLGT